MKLFRTLPLIAAMSLAFSGTVRGQSLVEMYESAKDFDASFKSAQLQVQAAKLKVLQAQARLGMNVNLNANVNQNYGNYTSPALTASNHSYSNQTGTVTGTQQIYRPGTNIEVAQTELQIRQIQAQLQAAEQDLMVRLSQAYFDVLAAQDNLTFIQAQMKAVAEQLASAKRNFEVGTATITDTREAQASYDLARAQEIAAINDLRVKKMALDQLVGKQELAPKPVAVNAKAIAPAPDRVDTWVGISEGQNPSVKQLRTGLEIADLEVRKAQAGLKPTVDAQVSYSYSNSNGAINYASTDIKYGVATGAVVLNWPLYSGRSLENRVREAMSLKLKAEADLDATSRTVAQSTRSAFYGVLSGISQISALEAAEESSKVALDANKLGYSVGVRININVLDAQSKLYDTKAKLAKARYDVLVGLLKLRQVSGVLNMEDLQNINTLLVP
jgi:outer membrane protein